MYGANPWTPLYIEIAKKLWADGLSASQIAAELGCGLSRNAVCGKLHRLGVPLRGAANTAAANMTNRARKPRPPKVPRLPSSSAVLQPALAEAPKATEPPAAGNVTFAELEHHHCKWPLGTPSTPEFRYCGAERSEPFPYCRCHCRMAYRPTANTDNWYVRKNEFLAERRQEETNKYLAKRQEIPA